MPSVAELLGLRPAAPQTPAQQLLAAAPELQNSHGGSFMTSIIKGLGEALMHPGNVYAGTADPYDTEQALNMAGAVMGGGVAGGPAGAVGTGPFRAFHGSPRAGLPELKPSERGPLGPGVYMTPDERLARRYAGDEGHIYTKTLEEDDFFQGIKSRDSSVNPYEVWRNQAARLVAAAPDDMKQAVGDLASKMSPDDGYPFYARLRQLLGSHEAAQGLMQQAGFKGMTGFVDGHEIVHFGSVPLAGVQ